MPNLNIGKDIEQGRKTKRCAMWRRYLQLHEAWRVQYREVKEAFDAGRHDLVREWVWCALEHS